MISPLLAVICVLSYFTCPYIHWKRMILRGDQLLPTICYIRCICWVFAWMISPASSIIRVISSRACPYTQWKRMILPTDQRLLIVHMYILEVCMVDFICRFNRKCYLTSPVPIHIEKEWSYPLVNFYQRIVYYMYILDAYMIDLVNLKCVILLHMSLCNLKTNYLTHWSAFTNNMLYEMYILGVSINDSASLVIHKCVILLHISLYTLKTNCLTQWSTFIYSMLFEMYILCLWINYLACLFNHKCVILLRMSLGPIHFENKWSYPWSSFINRMYITCTNWMRVWKISQVLSIISLLSCLTCPYTHWKRMIWPTDQRLSILWYIRCTYWIFVWMISTVLSIISVFSWLTCPSTHWKQMILPIGESMRKCYENALKSYQCEFSFNKNSYRYNSICGNPFLVRKVRGIGPIPREEYSLRWFRQNPCTMISS